MTNEPLHERERGGRFVIWRDIDGRVHVVAATPVVVVCDYEDGVLILFPGGPLFQVTHSLDVVLG